MRAVGSGFGRWSRRGALVRAAGTRAAAALALAAALTACHSSSSAKASHPPTSRPTAGGSATTVLLPDTMPAQTATTSPATGPRTVLSPIGLNVRAAASESAPVLGVAAQAAVLTVVGHTDRGGGWFKVMGASVTGWIRDDPALSAPGVFQAYSSSAHQFAALYPATWTVAELPPASVVFRPAAGQDTVVVTTAPSVAQLTRGRDGYHETSDREVVVCGVSGDLVSYVQAFIPSTTVPSTTVPSTTVPSTTVPATAGVVSERYLAQVHLTLDAQDALGIDANFADAAALPTIHDFLSSVSFPFPECE